MAADCIKLPHVRRNKKPAVDENRDDVYYWGFGRRSINGALVLNSSGGCALQMMHWFGCDPIILVGCDCMMVPGEGKEMHGNVFKDKQAKARGDFAQTRGGGQRAEDSVDKAPIAIRR